ncbi:hypothetical protein Tco_0993902 [Tanacetum coccineum]
MIVLRERLKKKKELEKESLRYQDETPESFYKILWRDLIIRFQSSGNDLEFWTALQNWHRCIVKKQIAKVELKDSDGYEKVFECCSKDQQLASSISKDCGVKDFLNPFYG